MGKSLSFLLDMPYSDKPAGQVKIQTVSKKYSVMLHTKHLICNLLPNCLFYSHLLKGRENKANRGVVWDRSCNVLVGLHYKITNCPNSCAISHDICTQFVHYLYSLRAVE